MLLFALLNGLFSTAAFPFEKHTLDCEIWKNFRPVSNLPYLSKLIEKVIAIRLVEHARHGAIMEKFQST